MNSLTPLDQIEFVVLDVETTGFRKEDRIVEFAAVRIAHWEPVDQFHTLLNPQCPIPPMANAVHQISEAMVRSAPTFAQVAEAIAYFFREAVLVGHNLFGFDLRFLVQELREHFGRGPDNLAVDTLPLCRHLLRGRQHRLEELASLLGIPLLAHQAMSDVYATAELWLYLVGRIKEQNQLYLQDLERYRALRHLEGTGLPVPLQRPNVPLLSR